MKNILSVFFGKIKNMDFNFQLKMERLKDKIKDKTRAFKLRMKKIPGIYQLVLLKRKIRNKIVSSKTYLSICAKFSELLEKILTPKIRRMYWSVKRSTGYKLCTRVFVLVATLMIALFIMNAGLDSAKSAASASKGFFSVSAAQKSEEKSSASSTNTPTKGENKQTSNKSNANKVKPGTTKEFVQTEDTTKWLEKARRNSYIEEHFKDVNGVKYYSDGSVPGAWKGIDVSAHQGNIDWVKVKKSGVRFAMIRVGARGYTSGTISMDKYFIRNIQNANKVGIYVGVYFFSQAVNEKEALEEAEFVINCIRKYKISMPVAFDSEYIPDVNARTNTAGLNNEKRTDICIAFCNRIKKAGYVPMIYDCKARLLGAYELSRLNQYYIWYARYNSVPGYEYAYEMWQYTEKGKVDGIKGYVDMNICMRHFPYYIEQLKNKGKTTVKSNSNTVNTTKDSVGTKSTATNIGAVGSKGNNITLPTPAPSVEPQPTQIEESIGEPENDEGISDEPGSEQDTLENTEKSTD